MIAWLLDKDIKTISIENTLNTKQIKDILGCKELDVHCVIDSDRDRSYIIWCSDDRDKKYGDFDASRRLLSKIPVMFHSYNMNYIVIAYNAEGSEIVDMDLDEDRFVSVFSNRK